MQPTPRELERIAGLPRAQQPWLATVWRRLGARRHDSHQIEAVMRGMPDGPRSTHACGPGATGPSEFAHVARLMTTNSPKLRTVIPSHTRPEAPILIDAKRELDRLGLGAQMFVPELRTVHEY